MNVFPTKQELAQKKGDLETQYWMDKITNHLENRPNEVFEAPAPEDPIPRHIIDKLSNSGWKCVSTTWNTKHFNHDDGDFEIQHLGYYFK
jgi:hypothetical protein